MIDNRVDLTIIMRNTEPRRERHYPHTWMIYTGGHAIMVHVEHDHASHPYVEGKHVA